MSVRQKSGIGRSSGVVVVVVRAAKEISRTALTWALTNVVQPGDCVRLLVVIPIHTPSKRLWGFPNFHSDCATRYWRFMSGTILEQKEYITGICNQMMQQLHHIYDPEKVTVKMKVVFESKDGVVAAEAKRTQAHWVVLDKRMEKEASSCTDQLDCNVVLVKNSETKVLRLNLIEQRRVQPEMLSHSKSTKKRCFKVPNVTPTSSPDRLSSMSSLDMFASPSFMSDIDWEPKVKQASPLMLGEYCYDDGSDSESDSDNLSSVSTSIGSQQWMEDNLSSADEGGKLLKECLQRSNSKAVMRQPSGSRDVNVREMISLDRNAPPDPPPLCSVCRHKSPSVGKPPRLFTYAELERATGGFQQANFLAEGGYGSVHRGVLPDGQVIAVKQHKLASSQGDREFCSEVQALSCAQHRNVVMLIGYCVEDRRRLLVYEYICNGSLDYHLYGRNKIPLDWGARQKIAVGAARGLRYLHEECRVGCIVHRDLRPNNILLTHDFEALVGDFGLARVQSDSSSGESRIIGTFGYIAPEYAQTGQVSEKADVYAFGVVLVELLTGRKAVDICRPKGEQCLTEWARPLLEDNGLAKHVDPWLKQCYSEREVEGMLHCASLCLQRDPHLRPSMSQLLRLLEGDISMA
ncbi:inactive protein kinase SELMODRAFT_444075-like [Salvia miltiorrhiza]|uniref:inactive protein kinase SELMODRAFT_444075-like n=1 Tax=Salvia miltiorrhiza TaxID=226208 RepID=UPI0025ABA80D|nr:inactive protein kinase SELMODRAFT_444075-like [Salvia miltiorrhiza]